MAKPLLACKGNNNLFLLPLCNYNNRSPAAGNDSQNGINCHQWAAIIYELTNNILTNNSIARIYFIMTRIMLFSDGYAWQIINNRKNAAALLAILMAMRIRRYGAEHIAQWGRSRANLDATGRRHWAIIRPVSTQRTPWSSILAEIIKLWHCETAFQS